MHAAIKQLEFLSNNECTGECLVRLNGGVIKVSPLLAEVFRALASGTPLPDIVAKQAAQGQSITLDTLDAVIKQAAEAAANGKNIQQHGYLWGRRDLFSLGKSFRLTGRLNRLYQARVAFWISLAALAIVNVAAALLLPGEQLAWHSNYRPIFVILGLAALIFLHELGHILAGASFGVRAGKIGCGVFLVFPVLYVDMTPALLLQAKERIIVSAAGVHAQLLGGAILILMVAACHYLGLLTLAATLMSIAIANILSAGLNFIPFLKLDGYWIISDLLRAERLDEQAKRKFFEFCRTRSSDNLPLLGFGALTLVCQVLLLLSACRLVYQLLHDLIGSCCSAPELLSAARSNPMALIVVALIFLRAAMQIIKHQKREELC